MQKNNNDNSPNFGNSDLSLDILEWYKQGFGTQVLTLDSIDSAKGGKGSGGGGNSGGGGTEDPNVLSSYTSGDADTASVDYFNIDISFKGTWTSDLQQAFIDASEYLSDVIQTGLSDVFYRGKTIDDIKIDASLKDIDGEGGILGQAGATSVRTSNYLPATAIMEFDFADASTFNQAGLWGDIILHEMVHSIGFSAGIWDYLGLISGEGTDSPYFLGENAAIAYEALYGGDAINGVPLEQDGGTGTAYSHWDEETFDNELMTGYINIEGNEFSDMSIAALEDMGYDTVFEASDYIV